MLIDFIDGLKFVVDLDQEYDYFDIVPDLEKKFRKKFEMWDNYLTIIHIWETKKRFLKSEFYEEHYELGQRKWGDDDENGKYTYSGVSEYSKDDVDLPIEITPEENKLIDGVIQYLGNKAIKSKWYVSSTML